LRELIYISLIKFIVDCKNNLEYVDKNHKYSNESFLSRDKKNLLSRDGKTFSNPLTKQNSNPCYNQKKMWTLSIKQMEDKKGKKINQTDGIMWEIMFADNLKY
jgi:hypothetical protein